MIEIRLVVILTVSGGSYLNPVQSYASLKVRIRQIWRTGAEGLNLKSRYKPKLAIHEKPRFIGLTHFDGALENMKKALSEERSDFNSSAEEPEIFEESVINYDS